MKKPFLSLWIVAMLFTSLLSGCASLRTEKVSYVRQSNFGFIDNESRTEARKAYDESLDPTSRCYDPASQNWDSLKFCTFDLEMNLHRARVHRFPVRPVVNHLYELYMAITKIPYPHGSHGPDFPAAKAREIAERYHLGRDKVVVAVNVAIEYHLTKAEQGGGFDARRALVIAHSVGLPLDRECAAVREDTTWHRTLGIGTEDEEWNISLLDWCGVPVPNHSTLTLRPQAVSYLESYKDVKDLSGHRLSKYIQAETDHCKAEIKTWCGATDLHQCNMNDPGQAAAADSCIESTLLEVATTQDPEARHKQG